MTAKTQKISIDDVFSRLLKADAVAINGIPALLNMHASDQDIRLAKENEKVIDLAMLSYVKNGYSRDEKICSNDQAEIKEDRSAIVLNDSKGNFLFSISFFSRELII